MPLGPPNLWAEADSRLQPRLSTSTGIWPRAWTASVWKGTPLSLSFSPISFTGWMTPVSLLAVITDTRPVSGPTLSNTSSAFTAPSRPGSTRSTLVPRFSRASNAFMAA